MNQKTKTKVLVVFLLVLFGVGLFFSRPSSQLIFSEKKVEFRSKTGVIFESRLAFSGAVKQSEALFFEPGTQKTGKDFVFLALSPGLTLGIIEEVRFLFFKHDFRADELAFIVNQPIELESDFWVFEKPIYFEGIPLPKTGLLSVGAHRSSKKLRTLSKNNNISLISTYDTDGFLLKLKKGGVKLFVHRSQS